MVGFSVLPRCYVFAMGIFAAFPSHSRAFSQGSIGGLFYVNFMIDQFSYLNITSIGRNLIQDENDCGYACLEIPSCFSYNVAAFPDVNNKRLCELLPSDKHNNSDKFNASKEFHHFFIPSSCDNSPCKSAGKCVARYQENGYKCICVKGFTGKNCETTCSEICGPHGDCSRNVSASRPCLCHLGYQWSDASSSCEDTSECLVGSHECLSPAKCVNTPGSYRCECPSLVGWSFDGRTCIDTDECQYRNVCDPQASCNNYPGGFNCSCNIGWRGQGEHPQCSDIDECTEGIDRCPHPSTCVNTPGSYNCVCNPGWEKVSEFQCSDINECSRGIHGCDRNSYCVNTAGSWKCICNSGWNADPSNARLPTCRDVNECVEKPNACPVQSTCLNSAGSYRCNCLSGWRNQDAHTCVDIDECSQGSHRCSFNSRCVNTQGSYRCSCLSGWRNQGVHTCVDIDECFQGSHRCTSNSRCVNTQGSYRCNCLSGWRNQGAHTCVDIDECSEGRYSCPSNSHCVNTQGSYRCDCNRCYYKSGRSCYADCRQETQYYYTSTYTTYTTYYSTSCYLGLKRCRKSRTKQKTKSVRKGRKVWVANRHGASCPC